MLLDVAQDFALPLARAFELVQRGVLLAPREGQQNKRLGVVISRCSSSD
jgi:hypothetical protein